MIYSIYAYFITMHLPTKVRFKLINHLSVDIVKSSKYLIYAHKCSEGVYVGVATDPVKRWQEHISDANNEFSHNYNDSFRKAIRKCGNNFIHYIIAVANTENIAKDKEAMAIKYYAANLNDKTEVPKTHRDFDFSPLEKQIGINIDLEKKKSEGTTVSREDSQRQTVIGEIYIGEGRKRVRTIAGQPFPVGMNIECSRSERERFEVGNKVRVNVALSEKSGTKYLVAAKTSKLVLVN